jgi:site-specific recombinase XerD
MNTLVPSPAPASVPAQLFAPTPKAAKRVLEFFYAQVENEHTRAAYMNAARRFAAWCEQHGIRELAAIEPIHVAAFINDLQIRLFPPRKKLFTPPTVKQHLAALRMLFDWLVTGHVIDVNPAHAVRGPKYVVRKGKTSVLTAEEARELLDSIPLVRKNTGRRRKCDREVESPKPSPQPSLVGLRDRALIGVMVYSFARINAVLEMKVSDYFVQGRRGWVRFIEKGSKPHEVPCHHNLEKYLDEYIDAAGIAGDKDGPLFRTAAGKTGELTGNAMWQQDAYRMVQRRAEACGIKTRIGNHTFRATGITAYLKNNGTLEHAQYLANHESPRTTKLYDRRAEEISLDEVEKISI